MKANNHSRSLSLIAKTGHRFTLTVPVLAFVLFTCSQIQIQAVLGKGDPNWEDLLKSGNQQLAVGETEKAIALFQKTVKKYPHSAACHTALGRALKRLGKLSEAKAEFKCACELESNFANAYYELGVIEESDKEWEQAAQAFSRYLELSPDSAQRKTIEDRIKYCKGQKE